MSANISIKALETLHNLYVEKKHKILSAPMGKEDTKNIWFELNGDMKRFLQDVLDNADVTGIRLYFLQNPDTQIDIDGEKFPRNPLDVKQLSVGLVATTNDGAKQADMAAGIPPINHGQLCPQICN